MNYFLVLLIPSIVSVVFFILWKIIAEKFFFYKEPVNLLATIVVFVISMIIMTNII